MQTKILNRYRGGQSTFSLNFLAYLLIFHKIPFFPVTKVWDLQFHWFLTFLFMKSVHIPGILWRHTNKILCSFSGQSMSKIVQTNYVYFAHCRRWFLNAFKERDNFSTPPSKKIPPPPPLNQRQNQIQFNLNHPWHIWQLQLHKTKINHLSLYRFCHS
jgi:hypothetical protein